MANNIYELDFTGVTSNNFIPEGVHTVRINGAEFKKAQTGSDQLQVTFETPDGAVRSSWYSLLPQALWKLKGFLETIGVPCEGKVKLNTKSIVGKTCSITVEPDANDATKLIITRVSKIAGAAPQNMATPPATPSIPTPSIPTAPVAPAPAQTSQQLPPWMQAPAQPTAQNPVGELPGNPTTPGVTTNSPSEAPVTPKTNLPPWMQNAGNNAPNGMMPPWMKQ
jgi:hypothetical protein